jgi:hypothetical protein
MKARIKMPRTLDLRDEKTRSRVGLKSETVSVPSRKKAETVAQEKRAVGDTRREIIDMIYDSPQPLTRLMICRILGRKKSPHLIALIEQLVTENVIARGCSIGAGGVVVYWYCAPSE